MKYDIEFIEQDGFVFDNEDDALFFAYYFDKYVIKKIKNYYIVIDLTILHCLASVKLFSNDIKNIINRCSNFDIVEINNMNIRKHGEKWDNEKIYKHSIKIKCVHLRKDCEEGYILRFPQIVLGSESL